MISHMAISKSIWGNLNMRLKKRGILISFRRVDGVEPKFEGPPVGLGSDMCGFMLGVLCELVAVCRQLLSEGATPEMERFECASGIGVTASPRLPLLEGRVNRPVVR